MKVFHNKLKIEIDLADDVAKSYIESGLVSSVKQVAKAEVPTDVKDKIAEVSAKVDK